MQEQGVNQSLTETEDILRRRRESAEAESLWQRQLALSKAGRPLSKGEAEEAQSIRKKLGERQKFLRTQFDQPLIYEEFTEVSDGIPMFDDFLNTGIFRAKEGRGAEIRTKLQQQNPELWEQLLEAEDKAIEEGQKIQELMARGEFTPTRYSSLNAKGQALVPYHPVVYEAYTKLHALLPEEERKRLGFILHDSGKVATANDILFSTHWE